MALPIDERPDEWDDGFQNPSFNQKHYYNLQNQSWGIPRKNKSGTLVDPVVQYKTDLGVYPSNNEVVWTGLQFQPVVGSADPFERLYTNLFKDAFGADTKAAKGYFIIDLLRRGQSRVDAYNHNKSKFPQLTGGGSLSIPNDLTEGGATIVQQFAGRVFYSGFSGETIDGDLRSPNLSNFVVFSQLIKNKKDLVKCYQEGDPTSRENNDLLDTDGGFIKVSGAEGILSLVNLGTSLIVIASNGVWAIDGGSDFGFSATNYKVKKISSFGGISKGSVVEDGSRAYYWSENGIYVIGRDQFGELTVQSITDTTIQSLYQSLSNTVKANSTGVYDIANKKIRWIFKQGTPFQSDSVTNELVFDSILGAFYPNRIYNTPLNDTEAFSPFSSIQFNNSSQVEDVLVGEDEVFSDVEQVVVPEQGRVPSLQATRYLVFKRVSDNLFFSFGYYKNSEFQDWGEVDAFAFVVTGEQTANESSLFKQIPYLTVHMRRTETGFNPDFTPINPSGCIARVQWDWTNDEISGRWSAPQQVYRYKQVYLPSSSLDTYNTGYKVITTKNKVRGRGKAFAVRYETEPLKDCRLLGWSLSVNGNSTV